MPSTTLILLEVRFLATVVKVLDLGPVARRLHLRLETLATSCWIVVQGNISA